MILGPRSARCTRLVLTLCGLAAALAGCGGGSTQYEPFVPDQYVAFGDETSTILADGRRYSVNTLTAFGTVDCQVDPIWTQAVANQFEFVFEQCNPGGATTFKATMRAAPGALADDLKTQIDHQIANGGFTAKTLVTVMLGANDVLDLYASRYPQETEEQLAAELRARGERLAQQVNRLVELGARVIVSTVPDLGITPYALQQKELHAGTDRAALISRLTAAFNGRVRVNILNDGRFVGLVLADETTQSIARFPSAYGVSNATSAACTTALPACTTQTLVEGGSSSAWLWADDRHLAYGGQARLGTLAVSRAVGNPF
jgi:hypothetical protein